MVLFKYGFKRLRQDSVLPDPHRKLSKVLSTSAIEEANKEVKDVLVRGKDSRRLPYLKATPEEKAVIGKYTAENRVVNAIQQNVAKSMPSLTSQLCGDSLLAVRQDGTIYRPAGHLQTSDPLSGGEK